MAAIAAGAVLGMLAKKGIPHRVEESLTRIQGLAVGLIGLNGVIASMFTVDADGGIQRQRRSAAAGEPGAGVSGRRAAADR